MRIAKYARAALLVLPLVLLCLQISNVHGTGGTLYVNPPKTALLKPGSSFSVTLKVSNMAPFRSWDIYVKTNDTVISPQSIRITGNILAANYSLPMTEFANCVNGGAGIQSGFPGNLGCTGTDGPGIAHSAVVPLGSNNETDPLNGLLFNITYKVSGLGDYSRISITQAQIFDSQGFLIKPPPSLLDGIYGNPPPLDFSIHTEQPDLNITQGQSRNDTLFLDSINKFNGSVTLSVTLSLGGSPVTEKDTGLNITFSPPIITLKGKSNSSTIQIRTKTTTASVSYTATIIARSGSLNHNASVTISVQLPPDFSINASPGLLRIHATDTGSTTIALVSDHGFSGNVTLSSSVVDSLTGKPTMAVIVSFDPTSLRIAPDGAVSSTVEVTTPPSKIPFRYTVTVTAVASKGPTHSYDIVVQPPPADLGFDVAPRSLSAKAGTTETFNVTLTSKDYFQGPVYLFATTFSGLKLSFTPGGVDFDLGNKTTSSIVRLTIVSDPTVAPGLHFIVLTAVTATITRSANVTLTLLSASSPVAKLAAKTILGLDPTVYFGIVGALAVVLTVATVMEARRERRPSNLLQTAS